MPDYVALNHDPYSGHQLLLQRCGNARLVLDVGCSAGVLARELAAQGAMVDGIEADPVAAAEAASVCRTVLVGDAETLDISLEHGAYDVILMADVIEHLKDPVALLARLRPLLRDSGLLLISTPNVANWSMRLRLLAGRWDYSDRGLLDSTHLRFFTRKSLVSTIREAGYRIADLDVTCPLPRLRREPFNRVAHDLASIWKTMLAYQFIVAARPGESS
jgi:2-polyprenyl-3-methyl-5-hydroxy-6-metoxy-1,4-benzoquinol methylase